MKKKISVLFAVILGLTAVLSGCGKEKETEAQLIPVTLNEVAHSVFYAPQYVAIEEGYFVKEGIKLELVTGFGADKVMAAVLSGQGTQILVLWVPRQVFMLINKGRRMLW